MIIPDANVLLYAVNRSSPHHSSASSAMDRILTDEEPVGFAWMALLAFLRLSTRVGIFATPLQVGESIQVIEDWIAQPSAQVIEPTASHAAVLKRLLIPLGTGGNLTSDAHLAALAVEYSAIILSYDHDFARFSGVKWKTPS